MSNLEYDCIVSIRAPRVGGDGLREQGQRAKRMFQSAPPVWGATGLGLPRPPSTTVSIRAPRVGGDLAVQKNK